MSSRFITTLITLNSLLARITQVPQPFCQKYILKHRLRIIKLAKRPEGDILDKCSYLVKLQKERRLRIQSNPLATLERASVECRISG